MAEQTYFEDIKEGQKLPEIKISPDKQQLVKILCGHAPLTDALFDELRDALQERKNRAGETRILQKFYIKYNPINIQANAINY